MLIHLIKKDCLLIKKYILIMGCVSIIAPPLLMYRIDDTGINNIAGLLVFFTVIFVVELLLTNTISMVETKYNKGTSYLCMTPYSRTLFVTARYLFNLLIYIVYCIIYYIVSIIIPNYMVALNYQIIGIVLLILSVFRGIIIPLEYKFGYEKSKYVMTLFMMGVPFVSSSILSKIDFTTIDITKILQIEPIVKILSLYGGSAIITTLSLIISIYIFNNKEL